MSMHKSLLDMVYLTQRHIRVFLADRVGMFFDLLSPLILLVLYMTFLRNVYYNSLTSMASEISYLPDSVINGFIAGWLISSILGVTCVTFAFCVNTLMITDKVYSNVNDFYVAPLSKLSIQFSYFIADFILTCLTMLALLGLGYIYIAVSGWYISLSDIGLTILTIVLTSLFGSLLASICESFISSSGGASGIATLASSMYGFLCGAYMPISQFSGVIRNIVVFIPGTYGTVLYRKLFLGGAINQMALVFPAGAIKNIQDAFDYNVYFMGNNISTSSCFLILSGSIVLLAAIYASVIVMADKQSRKSRIRVKKRA